MAEPLRLSFAAWCRGMRMDLDITQRELAAAVGVSRALISAYESGAVVPDLDMVERIGSALDVTFELVGRRPPIVGGARERDLLHARCSGYAGRRLAACGFQVAREVEVIDGRSHGWIDLLAFDTRSGRLLIVEVKTALDDIGAIERQVTWYERLAHGAARDRGWDATSTVSWLLVLATQEADTAVQRQRDVLDVAFPVRAHAMRRLLLGESTAAGGRGLALIDPARRRHDWLLPTRVDGRRTAGPYRDRGDALLRLSGPTRSRQPD
jgi:transcriptional regulator with XRE-family HTH domain